MKALVIAQKDVEKLLKSPRFFLSIVLSSLVAVMLLVLSASAGGQQMFSSLAALQPQLKLQLVFAVIIPGLILAVFTSNSDLLSRERSEGTILTLFSQPVSNLSIILGKFLTIAFTSLVFSVLNAFLLGATLPLLLVPPSLLVSFFFAALLFQLSIGGLTLLFSSLFKRSFMVLVTVIFVYVILVVLYSSLLTLSLDISQAGLPPGYAAAVEGLVAGAAKLFTIFGGIALGYAIVTLPSILGSGLSGMLPIRPSSGVSIADLIKITETPIIKFLPINVNAQRLLYFLTSPDPQIDILEAVASLLGLIGITALCLFLSLLIIRKARLEYQE